MRRMSFSATIPQMRDQTKTVTRRALNTWMHLEPGDRLLAIEKGMGLAKGQKQVVIGEIEIVGVVPVRLWSSLDDEEVAAEGFPGMPAQEFLDQVWCPMHGPVDANTTVRRIEFRHCADHRITDTGATR